MSIQVNTKRSAVIAALLFLFLLFLVFRDHGVIEIQITGSTMGTTYNIKIVDANADEHQDDIASRIQTRLDEINQLMSTYIPDSELSRFNQFHETSPFQLSPETFTVFQIAQQVSDLSNGAFDITVGPLVNAYGFGPTEVEFPSDSELNRLKERVGYHRLKLNPDTRTVQKENPEMYCDLSAIAKGYGVDQIALLIEQISFKHYMVEIGGEVRVLGQNRFKEPWKIAIEKPVDHERKIERIVHLQDISMATSGDYRNFYIHDGQRISHTIDPKTGRPARHNLASVSIQYQDCTMADALATAILVMGPDRGFQFAESNHLAALLIIRNQDDTVTERVTSSFKIGY